MGVLTRVFPPYVIDEVLAECGRVEVRHRLLPARVVVYYVLGLALFSTSSYEEVMRMLVAGNSWASGWSREWSIPTKAALFQARKRLGPVPLQMLYITQDGSMTAFAARTKIGIPTRRNMRFSRVWCCGYRSKIRS